MESNILRVSDIHPYDIPRESSWLRVNKLRFRKEGPYDLTNLGISLISVAGYILAPDGNHRIAAIYDRGIKIVKANVQEIPGRPSSYLYQLSQVQKFGIYSFDDYLYCCKTGRFGKELFY